MSALTKDRDTPERDGMLLNLPVAAATKIYAGSIVALDASGNAVPGAANATLKAVGRAEETVDNSSGSSGDKAIEIKRGVFRFANSADADEIGRADIGGPAYLVDDQTVAKTSSSGTRPVGGLIVDIDAAGVWVAVGYPALAANPAHARELLEVNKVYVPVSVASLVGADATVYRFTAPIAGAITALTCVLETALAAGDASVTASIGGVAVTDGALTITQSGSAPGDVDTVAPSAANIVTAGQAVALTVGGSNTANASAMIMVEITF